jgi:hypothetical protein
VSSALIVGERGSGLTTFVGLLYTAQVRLGTEEADEFRFHADRETIRQLGGIYGELGAGRFPGPDVDSEDHPLSFVLGFRNGSFRSLAGHRGDDEGGFGTVRVQVGNIPTQDLVELRDHAAVLDDSTRRLLRSQVVIPLIDASRLLPILDGSRAAPLVPCDDRLASTLDLLGQFLSVERDRRARSMHLLFVLTKLDQCPRETLQQLRTPPGPPAAWPKDFRHELGEKILERYLPATLRFLTASRRGSSLAVRNPRWYFSGLQTSDGKGVPRILRRSLVPLGGWEPEYPFEEYRALIERLGWLAQRLPDLTEN